MESTTSSSSNTAPIHQEQASSESLTNASQTPSQSNQKKGSGPELIGKVMSKIEKLQKKKEKIAELELKEKNHLKPLSPDEFSLLHSKSLINKTISDLEEIKTAFHEHIEKEAQHEKKIQRDFIRVFQLARLFDSHTESGRSLRQRFFAEQETAKTSKPNWVIVENKHIEALSRIAETIVAHSEQLRGAFDCWTELVSESDKQVPGTEITFKQIAERLPSLMSVPPFKSKPQREKKNAPAASPVAPAHPHQVPPQQSHQTVQQPVHASQNTTSPTIPAGLTITPHHPDHQTQQVHHQQQPTVQFHSDQQTQQPHHQQQQTNAHDQSTENGFRSSRRGGGGPKRYPPGQPGERRSNYRQQQQQGGDQQQQPQDHQQPRQYGGQRRGGGGRNYNNRNNTNAPNNISSNTNAPINNPQHI